MYQSLRSKGDMTFFLTYKISQDFIETTFSAIRSRLGYNDNPTCMKFKAAYKRILFYNEAVGSIFGNCSILYNTKNIIPQQDINIDHDYFENYTKISSFIEDTSIFIGGFIVKKIFKMRKLPKLFDSTVR
jgi:hypothetical protein